MVTYIVCDHGFMYNDVIFKYSHMWLAIHMCHDLCNTRMWHMWRDQFKFGMRDLSAGTHTHTFTHTHIHRHTHTHTHTHTHIGDRLRYDSFIYAMCDTLQHVPSLHMCRMGWLWLVGSTKLWVSFAKGPYKRDYILQMRPICEILQHDLFIRDLCDTMWRDTLTYCDMINLYVTVHITFLLGCTLFQTNGCYI